MKIQLMKLVIVSALVISVATPFSVSAAPSAGIKPSSFFYFFDIAAERINLFFTFNPEKKATKALLFAEERLAEVTTNTEEGKPEAIEALMANYENNISLATEKSKDVKDEKKAKELLTKIADSTTTHQGVLAEILNKVPEVAKEAIEKALEASKKGHEEALKQVAELRQEVVELKQEITKLKQTKEANSDNRFNINQAAEIENLKQEVSELKKQQVNSSKSQSVVSNQIVSSQKNIEPPTKSNKSGLSNNAQNSNEQTESSNTEHHYRAKDLIFLYQNRIKDLENDINSMYDLSGSASFKESFDYLKERRQLLLQRQENANNLRTNPEKFSTASKNYYYAQIINETVDEYLNDLNQEIIGIDNILRYGNSQIPVFKYHISEYQKKIASLSNDLEKIIPKDEFVKEWETGNKSLMLKWDIAENLNVALKKYLNNVTDWEDIYAFRRKIITNNIVWIGETQIEESQNYSRQLEQEQQLRQQQKEEVDKIVSEIKNMVPKTTRCTIRGDGGIGLEAYVDCYESSF